MVTPHPVGAPYLIQLFSDLAYVFGRSASLPKFFLCVRVFVVNVHTTFMHPPVELMLTGHSTLAFAGFSCAYNPKGITLLIFNTGHIFSALTFSFLFSFFWVFHALHFQVMYRRMIALIPCQTGSQSHDPSCGNFFDTFFSCRCNFCIIDASCDAFQFGCFFNK